MHLKYCSITGADDEVSIGDLSAIAREYPFVEWAILLLPSWGGRPRYPTISWIEKFTYEYQGKHIAMHLCDEALLNFIKGDNDISNLVKKFRRIQLNLKFGTVDGNYDPREMLARVRSFPEIEFILQYTKDKKDLISLFKDVPNHALLFDASAGRGICPDGWSAPLPGHFCGYAGGLNPDNLQHNLDLISHVTKDTWIDMETGVRTEDKFDFEKVRRVLEIAKSYTK